MAPAGGSANPQELLYGLHAVREALKAGTRPLQRLLVIRTDKQFSDLVQLARARHVPVHVQPLASLDRLVPGGKHQGIVAFAAAKAYQTEESILARAAFVDGIDQLSREAGFELPKGASAQVTAAARKLAQQYGKDALSKFVKIHFKTYREL